MGIFSSKHNDTIDRVGYYEDAGYSNADLFLLRSAYRAERAQLVEQFDACHHDPLRDVDQRIRVIDNFVSFANSHLGNWTPNNVDPYSDNIGDEDDGVNYWLIGTLVNEIQANKKSAKESAQACRLQQQQ